MSEMSKYIEMDNSARYQCLDRYIELSEKILKKDDAQTRYNGLSNLINDINLKIPDVIELYTQRQQISGSITLSQMYGCIRA